MIAALYVLGIASIVVSIIIGFQSGSIFHFLLMLISGIASSIIIFALAKILVNQESILSRIEAHDSNRNRRNRIQKKTCLKCGKEYDEDMNSCPYCGHKP